MHVKCDNYGFKFEVFNYCFVKIKFVETIGEGIASTISSAKITETTSRLLDQAKTQAEELAAQEEEMCLNMEELHGIIKALSHSAFLVEINSSGIILSTN